MRTQSSGIEPLSPSQAPSRASPQSSRMIHYQTLQASRKFQHASPPSTQHLPSPLPRKEAEAPCTVTSPDLHYKGPTFWAHRLSSRLHPFLQAVLCSDGGVEGGCRGRCCGSWYVCEVGVKGGLRRGWIGTMVREFVCRQVRVDDGGWLR